MKSEVIITGGGLIGITLACVLAKSDISTILFEQRNINDIINKKSDGRASAITKFSKNFLEKHGIWGYLKEYANPIDSIKISDENSIVDFDQNLSDEPMGYMIENQIIIKILYEQALNLSNLKIINEKYNNIEIIEPSVKLTTDKNIYQSNLLVAADGKLSPIRKLFNIATQKHDFKQKAIVCNINHQNNHHNIAYEKFSPQGPLAVLPLKGKHTSSIVWVEDDKLANLYLNMPNNEIEEYLAKKIGDYLGKIKIDGSIFSYKLTSNYALNYFKDRLALVGDSAHSIHPIAGQGLNMGIKDIESLINILKTYKSYGYDIGSKNILSIYEKARKQDNLNMLYITSILNSLFSNDINIIKNFRKMGLNLLNFSPIFKRYFIDYAMGDRG